MTDPFPAEILVGIVGDLNELNKARQVIAEQALLLASARSAMATLVRERDLLKEQLLNERTKGVQ